MHKRFSLRTKITVLLISVIALVSSLTFYIYNKYLTRNLYKNVEENIVSIIYLLKDYKFCEEHNDMVTIDLIKKMEEHSGLLNTYFADKDGVILYPPNKNYLEIIDISKLSNENEISVEIFNNESQPYTRVYQKMQNSPNCVECHDPSVKTLGYMVYDISLIEIEQDRTFILKFSIFFTFFLVVIIGFVISKMHYRFVKRSLSHFQTKIQQINSGDFDERLSIPESNELALLAKDFNEMLDKFQKTQEKLVSCHRKEIKNSKKLANVGEMAARLAHEIRNPITGIANAIEIIVDGINDEENKPILEEIQRQANRVNGAVSNLLIYSRSSEIEVQERDINELVKSLVFFLQNQNHNKAIYFELNLQDNIPEFNFDHEKLENALLNLGLNAIQAIPNSGTVTYKTSYDASINEVRIAVADTGIGVSEDILPKIFSPFFTTRTEGTGLGLAIVKDIVDKHQGEIWVDNNLEGGSTFVISILLGEN